MVDLYFQAWAQDIQQRLEQLLSTLLPKTTEVPQRLHDAMRYSLLGGGKRVRPLLAFAAGELSQADPEKLSIVAASVELIHAYSLVHDDLPCMDNDTLRRGKPTCHIQFDEATALLVGDSLQSLAFQLLAEYSLTDEPAEQLAMIKLLAIASGSKGMAGGQAIDLASIGKTLTLPELEYMHIHKTGALIRAAVLLGVKCGQPLLANEIEQIDHFAKRIGLAFQVVDDILDSESNSATLGKTVGKDAKDNKPTYVSIMGLSAAKDFAAELRADAIKSLRPFGERAERLRQLADFIIMRPF